VCYSEGLFCANHEFFVVAGFFLFHKSINRIRAHVRLIGEPAGMRSKARFIQHVTNLFPYASFKKTVSEYNCGGKNIFILNWSAYRERLFADSAGRRVGIRLAAWRSQDSIIPRFSHTVDIP
jgi:hypothetical protein